MKKAIAQILALFLTMGWLTGCSLTGGAAYERTVKNNIFFMGENLKGYSKSQLIQRINSHAAKMNTPVSDAKLRETDWALERVEKSGRRVNVEKTAENLLHADDGKHIPLVVENLAPRITARQLQSNIKVIGSYTTVIGDKKPGRVNNIEIAAQWIDNETVAPGEEFSFNAIVGKRTKDKGYENAPIIVKTPDGPKKGSGVGGGICQISSTLFNAAAEAGMEITERHSHSKKVGYVPLGKDATVSYGSTDFKFRNPGPYPVKIKIFIDGDRLTASLLQNRNPKS